MSLEILSCNADRRGLIGANHLEVKVSGHEISLPCPCASKSDYDKSEETGIPIKSKLFQYHVDVSRYKDLSSLQRRVKENYSSIVDKHKPLITDCNFYLAGHKWTNQQRRVVLETQKDLDLTFLSDVVFDQNQSLQDFETRLAELDNIKSDAIKCPTISMRGDFRKFRKCLDYIIDKKYQRFNVEWAGSRKYIGRWIYLSNSIRDKKIWCNAVAIQPPKPPQGLRRSYMAVAMAFGVHTFGHGYKLPPKNYDKRNAKSWLLDDTWCYNETHIPPYNASVESHNIMYDTAVSARPYIDNKSFYSDFVPKQFDLSELYSI